MGIWRDQEFDPTDWDDPGWAEMCVRSGGDDVKKMNSDALSSARKYFDKLVAEIDAEIAQRREPS